MAVKHGKVYLVGIGPGGASDMTERARRAISECEVLCGYTAYLDLLRSVISGLEGKKILTTSMRQEMERCAAALKEASQGKSVAMICSGDAGIYGMAGPVLEMQEAFPDVETEIIPGITAAVSGAAILGAPLMNDFCVISLSDLLTKWDMIEKRIRAAAEGDFVTVIYNPMSKRRPHHLRRACEIFLRYRTGDTPCGWVRNISRAGQEKKLLTLEELQAEVVDMFTTVYVGNSATRFLCAGGGTPGVRFEGEGSVFSGRQMTGMVTPRGYRRSESGENEF